MIRSLVPSAVATLVVGAPVTPAAAGPVVEGAPGHSLYGDPRAPDISGLWFGSFPLQPGAIAQAPPEPNTVIVWAPWKPPLTPAYQKIFDERIAALKKGRALGDIGRRCLPWGMPRMMAGTLYPDEFIQTPNVVSLFIFGTFPIMIWTDGRPHPADWKPTYNGHSIGRWEGNVLHVDTVGILPTTVVESDCGAPHSDRLHIVSTIVRVGPDTLHVHMTLHDPEALPEPMTITDIIRRKSVPKWSARRHVVLREQ